MRKDMNYIVLDVETPNGKNDSICSIGVELIDDDKVTDEWYTLVDPEEEFESMNIAIHHITPGMVQGRAQVRRSVGAHSSGMPQRAFSSRTTRSSTSPFWPRRSRCAAWTYPR